MNASLETSFTPESNEADEANLLYALMLMTLTSGFVDAVSYLELGHVFTANMTGNVVLLGFALAGAPRLSVARHLVSLLAFLLGGVIGGRLELARSATDRRGYFLMEAAVEAILLCVGALACLRANTVGGPSAIRLYVAIAATALAMGLRSATVHRLAVLDISTTTVITSILAAFAADSSLAGGSNVRVGRRVGSVLSMLAGAAIGTLLLRFGPAVPLIIGAVLVLAAGFAYEIWPRPIREGSGK
jgi:uncharacterized membrane protein YoaK (UPF0700 family)